MAINSLGSDDLTGERVNELARTYRDGLLTDVLPFWLEHGVDTEYGGILTSLDRDGTVIDTDKGVWQQGRFTWLLGELYNNVEPRQEWLDIALAGAAFMEQHCFDTTDGRMWFQVTRDGRPLRKRRYAASESFAAIAFGELALATGEQRFADLAIRCFEQFVSQSQNPIDPSPKFTDTRPTKSIGIPMITIVTAQELRQSIGLPDADALIDEAIATICRDHVKEEIQCVMETVGPRGEVIDHFDGRTLNPGHAIEAAWFMMFEGKYRGDRQLVQTGCKILDWMWERGWDKEFGGMLYFVDMQGLPVQEYWHDMKFWWPQNETIIATLLAYQLTGDTKYARWHTLVHDWAHEKFPDTDGGEWYGYLHRDGRVSVPLKGNHWKGPFHIPRMQLVCWKIAEELISR